MLLKFLGDNGVERFGFLCRMCEDRAHSNCANLSPPGDRNIDKLMWGNKKFLSACELSKSLQIILPRLQFFYVYFLDLIEPLLDFFAELGLLLLVDDGPHVAEHFRGLVFVQFTEEEMANQLKRFGIGQFEHVFVEFHAIFGRHGNAVETQQAQEVEEKLVVIERNDIIVLNNGGSFQHGWIH